MLRLLVTQLGVPVDLSPHALDGPITATAALLKWGCSTPLPRLQPCGHVDRSSSRADALTATLQTLLSLSASWDKYCTSDMLWLKFWDQPGLDMAYAVKSVFQAVFRRPVRLVPPLECEKALLLVKRYLFLGQDLTHPMTTRPGS